MVVVVVFFGGSTLGGRVSALSAVSLLHDIPVSLHQMACQMV